MNNAQREMTLEEWCATLPEGHRVRKELALKDARIKELEERNEEIRTLRYAGPARPLLYTDTVLGREVCVDNLWAITTEELNRIAKLERVAEYHGSNTCGCPACQDLRATLKEDVGGGLRRLMGIARKEG